MQGKAEFLLEKECCHIPPLYHFLHTFAKKDKIIAVPDVPLWLQYMQNKAIKFLQVDVGKNLAREVPDGKTDTSTPPPLSRDRSE